MKYLKFFESIKKEDVDLAGGKGASLGEMTSAKIPVPPGFVVLASAFDLFLKETDLNTEIEARLREVNPEDINSVTKASSVIQDAIHDQTMPENLSQEILKAHTKLKAKFVAVRSSATAEDSKIASWAGELDTFLNTSKSELIEKVKECWASLFTPRAISYRHEKKLIDHYVSVAVVVQKMVQSEISGITFTTHPVTEDPNQMIIEAVFGLGEAIVGGKVNPDSYVVDKAKIKILDINIGEQEKKLSKKGQKNIWQKLNQKEGNKQKLTEKQIIKVAKVCQTIEKHYKFPCDIEWAIEGNKIYITQSRPITTLK